MAFSNANCFHSVLGAEETKMSQATALLRRSYRAD